jgi:AcrR family transcriptional regulator
MSPSRPTPKPGSKRARTRRALLEAARELLQERGYAGTTLEAVAERAGMSTGAIYGNFKNRSDLFVTLGLTHWAPIRPRVADGAELPELMRALAEATLAVLPERTAAASGRLIGMAHTLRDPELQAEVAEITADSFAMGAEWIAEVCAGQDLPMPPEHLVLAVHALSEGLVFQRILTPQLVPDAAVYAAFAALAGGGATAGKG